MDSGWKYMYDKYNDVFRYVPLNGDTAGLMVQSDLTRDPWYSLDIIEVILRMQSN